MSSQIKGKAHRASPFFSPANKESEPLIRPERRDLIIYERHRHRLAQIRKHDHPVAILLACALRHLSERQLDLALIHPQNHLVRIDSFPDLRPPMFVELMRIVIEKNLVGKKRVLTTLPIPYGNGILLGGLWRAGPGKHQ